MKRSTLAIALTCATFGTTAFAGPLLDPGEGPSATTVREVQRPGFQLQFPVEPMLGGIAGQLGGVVAAVGIASTLGGPIALPVLAVLLASAGTVGAFVGTMAGVSIAGTRVDPNMILLYCVAGGAMQFVTFISGMPLGLFESALPTLAGMTGVLVSGYVVRAGEATKRAQARGAALGTAVSIVAARKVGPRALTAAAALAGV